MQLKCPLAMAPWAGALKSQALCRIKRARERSLSPERASGLDLIAIGKLLGLFWPET